MKNRIISLVLGLLMCLSAAVVFAGCTSGNVPQVIASDAMAQTIVLAMIRDERTTDAAVKTVEDALNKITETNYNTHIVLKMFTEEEYEDRILTMSKNLHDAHEAYENKYTDESGQFSDTDNTVADLREYDRDENVEYMTVANGDLMYYNESGRLVTLYPKVSDDQLDVIFINDLSLYYKLVQNRYVIGLSSTLASESAKAKKLSMLINAPLYARTELVGDGADYFNRNMYAIPNNYVVSGERYILVNKKLYDHYQYSVECNIFDSTGGVSAVCDDLADFIDYLEDVAENNDRLKEEGSDLYVDKILYNFSDIGWLNPFYDKEQSHSALMLQAGNMIPFREEVGVYYPESVFTQPYFVKTVNLIDSLRSAGYAPYIGERFFRETDESVDFPAPAAKMEDNEETFALAMVTGDRSVETYYDSDDYYVVKIGTPFIDNKMFESMFAVGAFSTTALDAEGMNLRRHIAEYEDQDNPRCLEIIYALQTDAEIVNLLTYGVNGYNYDIYENESTNMVHNAGKNDYYPIVGKAGNLFLTYPNESMSARELFYSENNWKAAKNQLCEVSVYCGIPLSDEAEDGAEFSSVELKDFFIGFYNDKIGSVLNFDGTDGSGNACTLDEYLEILNKELTSSAEYKFYNKNDFSRGFKATPKALMEIYFNLFYLDTNAEDIGYVD